MFTTFTLLLAAGVGFRLALSHLLRKRFYMHLAVPQAIAVLLIVLATLPDLLLPVAFPLPVGLVTGFVLPDLLFRRV